VIRWLVVIPFALLLALTAGALVFLVAAVADPVLAPLAGHALFAGFWGLMDAVASADDPDAAVRGAFEGAGRLVFSLLILPPLFIALVGEVIGTRALLWYAGATAALAASMPWILRAGARAATPDELRVSLILALTGAAAGLVYWTLAGRGAGRSLTAPMPRES
jgi:hypothetical protein